MRMDDIRDLPYPPGDSLTREMMDEIISYCDHDVNATHLFYDLCEKDIALRKQLSETYGLDLVNANDPKIGSEIFLDLLSKEMDVDKKELKEKRTYRESISFNEIILNYIKFDTLEMNEVLYGFKSYVAKDTKGDFKFTGKIGNIENDFGQGGIHGCTKAGVYKSTKDRVIIDIDVASFYPNLAINNGFRPLHLGKAFSKIYKSIYELRKTFPKSDPRNTACKLMLNGSFGKMNDEYSFLYDPKCLLSITLNGQLLLAMLMEKINSRVDNIEFLQSNTDGFTFLIDRDKVDYMKKIVSAWEKKTELVMEYAIYEKMVIRDVNNYMSITDDGKIKFKGAFEMDRDYNKNHSKRIVSIALANYFIHACSPLHTIKNHLKGIDYSFCKNYGVHDFCAGVKMTGKNVLVRRIVKDYQPEDHKLGKVTRYYISNNGDMLVKKLPPLPDKTPTYQINIFDEVDEGERESNIEAGYNSIVFNQYIESDSYDINYDYYLREINKIINVIEK
tara:strand:- start:92123 stop:93631 length:1509 start_codon:yes stop_codon:yes gene_type:complete